MAHSNGIITAPVGIDADIAPVLGVGSFDLGYLCSNSHGKINKWSKKKPVRYNKFTTEGDPDWWKGLDGNCGLILPKASNIPSGSSPMQSWGYSAPIGGDSSPYRALDFDGYNHNARVIFYMYPDPTMYKGKRFQCSIRQSGSSEIKLGDIHDMTTGYVGIVLRFSNDSILFITDSVSIGEQSIVEYLVGIDIPSNAPNGNVDVWMVLSNIPVTTVQSAIGTTLISLNQDTSENAFRQFQLKDELPNYYTIRATRKALELLGQYEITFTVTAVRGNFYKDDIVIRLSSEPEFNLTNIGDVFTSDESLLMQGTSFVIGVRTIIKVDQDIITYLNYDSTYQGSSITASSGSIRI